MIDALIAALLLTSAPAPLPTAAAPQTQCPPAGARFRRNNITGAFVVVSLGGAYDDTLWCRWRREDTGATIWLTMELMTPLGGGTTAGAGTNGARPANGQAAPSSFGPVQTGVYECDAPINVGGMVMGSPQTGLFFGVTGPGAYRDFNGGRGAFSVSGNVLTMTSGPLRGTRYRREGATLFKPLNAQGQTGSIRCVLNRAKSLTGRW